MKELDRKLEKMERRIEISVGKSLTESETNVMAAVKQMIDRTLRKIYGMWMIIIAGLLLIFITMLVTGYIR